MRYVSVRDWGCVLVPDTISQVPVDKDSHHSWIFIFQPPESSRESRLDTDLFQDLLELLALCEELVIESDWVLELEDSDLSAHDCLCDEDGIRICWSRGGSNRDFDTANFFVARISILLTPLHSYVWPPYLRMTGFDLRFAYLLRFPKDA
jgi:hypothetical protein